MFNAMLAYCDLHFCPHNKIIYTVYGLIMPLVFLLLVVIPVTELLLLIEIGGIIGGLNTVLLVFSTAIIGTILLKREGLATFNRFNQKLRQGEMPANEIATGFALVAGGALLLTPGFMTDIIGFLLVLPFTRALVGRWIFAKVLASRHATFTHSTHSPFSQTQRKQNGDNNVIEGEFEHKQQNK